MILGDQNGSTQYTKAAIKGNLKYQQENFMVMLSKTKVCSSIIHHSIYSICIFHPMHNAVILIILCKFLFYPFCHNIIFPKLYLQAWKHLKMLNSMEFQLNWTSSAMKMNHLSFSLQWNMNRILTVVVATSNCTVMILIRKISMAIPHTSLCLVRTNFIYSTMCVCLLQMFWNGLLRWCGHSY